MKLIPLTGKHGDGKFAKVDDELFDYLNQWKWRDNGYGYAVRPSNGKYLFMHRVIMEVSDRKESVDHKDHDTLNNQKYNLRKCTHSENLKNSSARKGSTSKYLGVSWRKTTRKWRSVIRCNYIQFDLGEFKHEWEAALAYDTKAKELFGEFANPNFKNQK